jgi:hypothetical protein
LRCVFVLLHSANECEEQKISVKKPSHNEPRLSGGALTLAVLLSAGYAPSRPMYLTWM